MKRAMKKVSNMFKLVGIVTVVYFAWTWGVISAVWSGASMLANRLIWMMA